MTTKQCRKTKCKVPENISLKVENIIFIPTTDGSRSMNMARGTCFPVLVSLKNVLNELSCIPMEVSEGMSPSFWIPCSRQYSSQHALPIWTPACPIWTDITSR